MGYSSGIFMVNTVTFKVTLTFSTFRASMNFFIDEPTFNKVLIRPYTNITGYAIGMALGYIIYYWQQNGGNPQKFQVIFYLIQLYTKQINTHNVNPIVSQIVL